jgi:DNA-binding NarL/FixJ family response regulator
VSLASESGAVRVVLADDHPIWRDAVERDLAARGFLIVGTAADGEKAVRVCRATQPDVLVCDLSMPGLNGAQVTARVTGTVDEPVTHVLILSASGASEDVLEAVKAGAAGYLLKSASSEDLADAVTRTAAGEAVFSPELAGLLLGEYRRLDTEPTGPRLTERETEVLRMVAKGLTSRQVAERLVLSIRTVENHVNNTLAKLQLHSRSQLVRYAIETGLDTEASPRA